MANGTDWVVQGETPCTCGKEHGGIHRRTCAEFCHVDACCAVIGPCVCPPGHDGREPLPFNRQAIIDAYVTFAYVNAGEKDPLVALAWRARVEKVRELSDLRPAHMSQFEAIEALDDDTREHYFALLALRLGGEDPAAKIRDAWERKDKIDGVTVHVSNTGDCGPCYVDFTVRDDIASAWADGNSDIAGDSWETADDDMVYASTFWHETLIEDLQKEGYDLDLSEYSEPDETDLKADEHRRWCENESGLPYGERCSTHQDALDHVEKLAEQEHVIHWEAFVDALAVIAHLPLDTWQPALFGPWVLWPGTALAVARGRVHEGVSP